jgi:RNA polymerase sigma-70 factor (ECF subfamily)
VGVTPSEDLERLRRGDPEAMDQLYRDHAPAVLGWVIRLGGERLDAEDVAQRVFEVALNRIHTYRGDSSLRTWIYGICRRVVANARRRAAIWSWLSLDVVQSWVDGGGDPERSLATDERRKLVLEALGELKWIWREVVVLVDLEERPAVEVAELLGIELGTVYSRTHKGRKALAAALERRGVGPDGVIASPRST